MGTHNLTRRRLLACISVSSALTVAGCTSGDDNSSGDESTNNSNESGIQDTDGDGVIDSEDYAPRDEDVQSRSDVTSNNNSTESNEEQTRPSNSSSESSNETPPEEVTYPSHSGTHTITARDNFWAWEFSVNAEFVLDYRAINMLDESRDFDVLLYPPERFEEYRAIANGVEDGIRPQYLDGSAPGVESGVEASGVQLPAGTYYLVLDNTDLSDAGDWGSEETRRIELEATTGSV